MPCDAAPYLADIYKFDACNRYIPRGHFPVVVQSE